MMPTTLLNILLLGLSSSKGSLFPCLLQGLRLTCGTGASRDAAMQSEISKEGNHRELRDVAFEDLGSETNSLLTLKTEGVGTSHLNLIWVRCFK